MENKKQIKATDVLFIGLALFATYFGAGNLIFPPMLGLQSGTGWGSGMIGMIASGVGLPVLAMIILGHCGSVQRISDHVHKNFYHIFVGMIMVLCCCVSIPRTAAVGIEMGLQGLWGGAPYLVSVVIYFLIAFFFAKDRGTALDKVGKILTPVMTVILFILVIKGFISPIGTPSAPTVDNAFLNSFLGGYSTGDVLVSFLMASLFFGTIREKGYEGASLRKVNFGAGIIAAVCLAVVYGGLFFMGACVSGEYSADSIGNADLLLNVIRSSGGQIALYGLCLSDHGHWPDHRRGGLFLRGLPREAALPGLGHHRPGGHHHRRQLWPGYHCQPHRGLVFLHVPNRPRADDFGHFRAQDSQRRRV